jgi:hypothetical protein
VLFKSSSPPFVDAAFTATLESPSLTKTAKAEVELEAKAEIEANTEAEASASTLTRTVADTANTNTNAFAVLLQGQRRQQKVLAPSGGSGSGGEGAHVSLQRDLYFHHLFSGLPAANGRAGGTDGRAPYFDDGDENGAGRPTDNRWRLQPQGFLAPRTCAALGRRGLPPLPAMPTPKSGGGQVNGLVAVPHPDLPGQYIVPNFLSVDEEADLLTFLDGGGSNACSSGHDGGGNDGGLGGGDGKRKWKLSMFNGPHFGQKWGVRTDLKKGTFKPAEEPLPREFHFVIDRARQLVLSSHAGTKVGKSALAKWRPFVGIFLGFLVVHHRFHSNNGSSSFRTLPPSPTHL